MKLNKEKANDAEELLKQDPFLKMHLDSYHVDTPEIPRKKSSFDRILSFLASPAANPLENYINKGGSLTLLTASPIAVGAVLAIVQLLRL
jgi:hypothetical protein